MAECLTPRLNMPTDRKLVARQPEYKAVETLEKNVNIAIAVGTALVTLVSAGVGGMLLSDHLACKSVAKQEEIMQKSWDSMHPDGFTPAGDQMRPVSFDCSTQERGLKPLQSYTNGAEMY